VYNYAQSFPLRQGVDTMPEILRPTNPVPNYDNAGARNQPISPRDTNIQNVVDPSRVTRADQRTEQQQAGDAAQKLRYESNFLTFVQRLRNSPDPAASFLQLLGRGLQVSSGISEGLAVEMSQFLEYMQMDEGKLLDLLQNQLQGGTRFGGALFDALRTAYNHSGSEMLRSDILQFLRQYSDFTSTGHLEGRMVRTLYDMTQSLPSHWAGRLLDTAAQMENGVAAGDRQGNLQLLRDQVFPLISNYVSTTHDHGRARTLLSMLTLDMVRYENGSEEEMVAAFRHLNNYGIFPEDLGKLSDEDILRLLKETEFTRASSSDKFTQHLTQLTGRALGGEANTQMQDALRNIMASILVNESVYMPLRHLLLPFQWEDKAVFSEMWVDPDEDNGTGSAGPSPRILIKMDIEGLGVFDLLIDNGGGRTSINVSCPESVAAHSGEVSRSLGDILERNGLRAGDIRVGPMRRAVNISDAFPKIFEGVMNGVDVKV